VKNAANAANENRSPEKPAQNGKTAPYRSPIVCSSGTQTAEKMQETKPPDAATSGPARTIRAKDYKPLEIPEPQTVCYACGKHGAWYVEKFTAERRARPKDQQDARRVCRSASSRWAVSRAALAVASAAWRRATTPKYVEIPEPATSATTTAAASPATTGFRLHHRRIRPSEPIGRASIGS
jgi:hypothetical protein